MRLPLANALGKNADASGAGAPAFSLFTSAASADSAAADSAYLHRAFALAFSDAIKAEAHGQERKVRFTVESADGTVLRLANAVIPDAPRAAEALEETLLAAIGAREAAGSGAGSGKASSVCWPGEREVVVTRTWWEDDGTGDAVLHVESASYCESVISDEDMFEGPSGGGDPFGGPSDPSNDPCWECGGGGGFPPAEPCEVNPALPGCPADILPYLPAGLDQDELKRDYEDQCADELKPFESNPSLYNQKLSELFEGDVRRALGFETGVVDAFDVNRKFDGVRRPLTPGGYTQPGYYIEVLEVKFTSGSDYAYSGRSLRANSDMRQAEAIINNLNRVYGVNVGGVRYLPTFRLVTLSQAPVNKVDELGLVAQHADTKNVNFMHYHVYENAQGQRYLQGEIVGDVHFGALHVAGQDFVLEKPNWISKTKSGTTPFAMTCKGL